MYLRKFKPLCNRLIACTKPNFFNYVTTSKPPITIPLNKQSAKPNITIKYAANIKKPNEIKSTEMKGGKESYTSPPTTTKMTMTTMVRKKVEEVEENKENVISDGKLLKLYNSPNNSNDDDADIVNGPRSASTERNMNDDGDASWRTIKLSLAFITIAITSTIGYLFIAFGRPKYETDGSTVLDEYSNHHFVEQYYKRAKNSIIQYYNMIKKPSRDKLLPDVLKPPYYQPPYTLILEFTNLLVHPEWTYNNGWRFKKRPGLDQFLEALYMKYEMVVYTAEMGMTVFPIIDTLDKNNLISYKLVRDATHFIDGCHTKDLDKLNRRLDKVIVIDWNPESMRTTHKDNLFQIPKWNGNDDDRTLYDLTAFLLTIADWDVADVRSVLKHYAQFNENALDEFKQRQLQLMASSKS